MTALRQSAIMELEKIPEDKLSFVIQIMQGVNGLYNDTNRERKEAFARLEQLRKKGIVADDYCYACRNCNGFNGHDWSLCW